MFTNSLSGLSFCLATRIPTAQTSGSGAVQVLQAVPAHPTGVCTTHLAQGEDPLLGPNNAALQHDEVVGHLAVVDEASLSRERTVSACYKVRS